MHAHNTPMLQKWKKHGSNLLILAVSVASNLPVVMQDDSGEISGPLVSLLAPPVHLPPSSTTANPAAGLPRSAMQTRQQGTASKYNVVTNPLAGLPPNTMQARTEPATSPRFLQTSLLASLRQGSLRFEEDRPEVGARSMV